MSRLDVTVGQIVKVRRKVRDFEAERKTPGNSRIFTWQIEEMRVTKVGRKYVYVQSIDDRYPYERKFDLETGMETGNYIEVQMFTPESLAAQERREAAVKTLNDTIDIFSGRWVGKLTTEAIEDIVRIVTNKEAYR
ncbi:hypothetical protein QLT00_gp10 [Gordonia phage Commandaria]|uniref:Uncharacterized protein n=1 Tax=Gordonia phage Commandaria TaxID=3038364 RepID=A0AAF0GLK7_9CAUD|nr:hypothetical protein QLT00_gp10 [Gordonia phage Commandaria]WGH20793.1 hypothetical protein [Gordonia phage Commandaria]